VRAIPGYRKGFEWKHEEPSKDMLRQLLKALGRATLQVEDALWHVDFGEYTTKVATPGRVFVPASQNIKAGVNDGYERIGEKVRVQVGGRAGVQTRSL
jgi:hypothetical protein